MLAHGCFCNLWCHYNHSCDCESLQSLLQFAKSSWSLLWLMEISELVPKLFGFIAIAFTTHGIIVVAFLTLLEQWQSLFGLAKSSHSLLHLAEPLQFPLQLLQSSQMLAQLIAFATCRSLQLFLCIMVPLQLLVQLLWFFAITCATSRIVTITFHDLQDLCFLFCTSWEQSLIAISSGAHWKLATLGGRGWRSQILEDGAEGEHGKDESVGNEVTTYWAMIIVTYSWIRYTKEENWKWMK